MKIKHHMKRENSGLARTTLELAAYEEKAGHQVCIVEPGDNNLIYGVDSNIDVHTIHSQLNPSAYFDKKPKFMWMHGEGISSVANGVSMKAIVDLAPKVDAFIAMRPEEMSIWQSIKRTYLVPKGIDLEFYRPLENVENKLSGEPAILYMENWRGSRNPLYLCLAMEEVWAKLPNARLHLYNCQDKKMFETFQTLIRHNKWWTFARSLTGPVPMSEINMLLNRVDIVVSCLFPLYARSIEALAAGKAFIGPGYKNPNYPFQCDLEPHSMAQAIINCWENYDKINYRKWAEDNHDVRETVRQSVEIYERYI